MDYHKKSFSYYYSLILDKPAQLQTQELRAVKVCFHVRIQRGGGGRGSGLPLENDKHIGFLSNTGPDPLKITKLPIQHLMLGHHRPASETPLKWCFAGGPLMARL